MLNFTFKQMINFGMHIGHSIQNTLLLASWLLFKYRQNIWFINLQISLKMFKIAFKVLKFIVGSFGPIWFVNLDKSVERYISHTAKLCGEFFCSSWVNGMISNFCFIKAKFKKERKNLMCDFWYLTRYSSPRLIFSFSALKSAAAVSEALAYGVPCIAIIDTNVKSQAVTLPIPGNDDSLDSIIFYNEIISNFILKCKFGFVLIWFSSIRKSFIFSNFKDWLKKKGKEISFLINNNNRVNSNSAFSVNYSRLFSRSFISFFSQGYWLNQDLNHFRYFYEKNRIIFAERISKKLLLRSRIYFQLIRIYFIKILNFTKFFFRRRRKIIQKFHKRHIFCKLLMKYKSATYFIHGGFVRKYLTKRFKDKISSKKFFWNLCYLFYNNIRFSRQILYTTQEKKKRADFSEWLYVNEGWSLSSEYNSNILNIETEENQNFNNKIIKKNKFNKKLKRIFNREYNQEKFLNKAVLFTNNRQKFLNFAVFHKWQKKNLLHRLFLDLWVRLSLTQLGLNLNYKQKLGNSLKILKAHFYKFKRIKNKILLSEKWNFINFHKNLTKKFKFNLGWFSFNEILPFVFSESNKNLLYSDRIYFANFWYFWRFFCSTLSFKRLKISYKGPGFYLERFNLFYRRKMPLIESLDYSIFKSINILKKYVWKKKLKSLYTFTFKAKANLKMCKLVFMLTLDKRFDIVRKTCNKILFRIENIRKSYNFYAKNSKFNRKISKFNRKNSNRKKF